MKRILYVSSKRCSWSESQSSSEHFANAPYSIDAIGYNLEKLGWTVGWCGWKGSKSPFMLAKRIVKNSDAVVTLSYELQKIGRSWGVECNLSVICRRTKRFEEAEELARKALKAFPDSPEVKQTLHDAVNSRRKLRPVV